MPPTIESCGSCRFWIDDRCKRYPPQVHIDPNSMTEEKQVTSRQPRVSAEDWCGEYIKKV